MDPRARVAKRTLHPGTLHATRDKPPSRLQWDGELPVALRSLGVGAGSRFGIIYRNDLCQADLIHPGYRMGVVPVPINYRLTPVEIADILDGISPRLLAVEDHWANLAAELASRGRREPLLWIGSDHDSRAGEPDLRDTARRFGRGARKRSGRRCAHRALPATYRRLQGAAPIPPHRGHAEERDGDDPQVRSPPPGHARG